VKVHAGRRGEMPGRVFISREKHEKPQRGFGETIRASAWMTNVFFVPFCVFCGYDSIAQKVPLGSWDLLGLVDRGGALD
jgi:hypothetical protein